MPVVRKSSEGNTFVSTGPRGTVVRRLAWPGVHTEMQQQQQQQQQQPRGFVQPQEEQRRPSGDNRRKRTRASMRKALHDNWILAEARIVKILEGSMLPPICICAHQETVDVRFVSMDDYKILPVKYCICGLGSSMLVSHGYFPSSPLKPRTVFSIGLLRTLHVELLRGGSVFGWGEDLREAHERKLSNKFPPFHQLLRDAYEHFIVVEAMMADTKNQDF